MPVNSLVSTDLLLLSKFEKEFRGLDFNSSESKTEEPSVSSETKKEEEAPTQVMFKKKKG